MPYYNKKQKYMACIYYLKFNKCKPFLEALARKEPA